MGIHFPRIDRELQETLAQNEPAVKVALSEIANAAFDLPLDKVESLKEARRWGGVLTAEGGIHVNGKEIRLFNGNAYLYMCAGWRERGVKPEESALADAVKEVAEFVKVQGIGALAEKYQKEIEEYERRDLDSVPLYQFLDLRFQ